MLFLPSICHKFLSSRVFCLNFGAFRLCYCTCTTFMFSGCFPFSSQSDSALKILQMEQNEWRITIISFEFNFWALNKQQIWENSYFLLLRALKSLFGRCKFNCSAMDQKMTLVKDNGARWVLQHYGKDMETPKLTGECNSYSNRKKESCILREAMEVMIL
jgi:hypothetical protein